MPDEEWLATLEACGWKLLCPLLSLHSGVGLEEVKKSEESVQAPNRSSHARMQASNVIDKLTFTGFFIIRSIT
jgi:hypothetical protein